MPEKSPLKSSSTKTNPYISLSTAFDLLLEETSHSALKRILARGTLQPGDIELYKILNEELISFLAGLECDRASLALAAFKQKIAEVQTITVTRRSVISEPETRLGCGCTPDNEKIMRTIEGQRELSGPLQIVCGKAGCCYCLSDQEIILVVGPKIYSSYMERYKERSEMRCVLCGETEDLLKLHSNHALCEECNNKYERYIYKARKLTGSRCPCPVRACSRWFIATFKKK